MPEKIRIILTEEEVEKLLAVPNITTDTGLRNRAMLETMLFAGLRVSEVCNLAPGHLDWKRGIVQVFNGKGGAEREVPVHKEHLDWLALWNDKRPKHSRYFFCSIKSTGPGAKPGNRLSPRYLDQMVKQAAEQAGIQQIIGDLKMEKGPDRRRWRVHCHTLRHTFATRILQLPSIHLQEVQCLLGHKNLSTTSIYLHTDKEELRKKIQSQPDTEKRQSQADVLSAAAAVLSELAEQHRVGEPTE